MENYTADWKNCITTQNTNEFQGFFAEFFDMLHENCEDADIYPVMLKPYGNKILELGSGTGRIAIPLAKAGFHVTGIEIEMDMIRLMENKEYPRERLQVICGDARSFAVDDSFDAILLSCNFINHFPDAADIVAMLKCCQKHLKQDGCIIIDCSAPDVEWMVKSNGVEEILSFSTENQSTIKDVFRPCYDLLNQIEHDTIVLEEWKDGVLLRKACTEESLTWYYPREIRSLIREAGMKIRWESACLSADGATEPIQANSTQMVFCCN